MFVIMHGPAFDDSGKIVERQVPDADVRAFEDAGYRKGALPDEFKAQEVADDLPDDFPVRDVLVANNIHTVTQAKAVEDFTSFKGIGKATAEKIQEALKA